MITLDRSCVDYKITFDVERGESAIPVASSYFEIRTAEDWNTFCTMVENAGGKSNVNASLLADISVTKVAAYTANEAYRGIFEGNGHTLTLNISDNSNNTALFSHVSIATFRNLNVKGSVKGADFTAALVGCVDDDATFVIENCHVSASITTTGQYAGG